MQIKDMHYYYVVMERILGQESAFYTLDYNEYQTRVGIALAEHKLVYAKPMLR